MAALLCLTGSVVDSVTQLKEWPASREIVGLDSDLLSSTFVVVVLFSMQTCQFHRLKQVFDTIEINCVHRNL